MNSFIIDIRRAVGSIGFAAVVIVEFLICVYSGYGTETFYMSVPVAAAIPYSTAWIVDYQSGFIKQYIGRTTKMAYITGKFLACGVSGGGAILMGAWLSSFFIKESKQVEYQYLPIFAAGFVFAVLAQLIATVSMSRYIAYGGGFVICYALVIVYERYARNLYMLCPYEWSNPQKEWMFGETGLVMFLIGISLVLLEGFALTVGRKLNDI